MREVAAVQLCLGLVKGLDMVPVQQLLHMKAAGFDGFFALWEASGQLDSLAQEADRLGLLFQSVHAPFRKTSALWEPGNAGDLALEQLLSCLSDCRRLRIPIMVSHVFMGFELRTPNELGLSRFRTLFDAANAAGVKIALENVESIPHLQALLNEYPDPHIGLCWDSGHAHCYNRSHDLLRLYGHRLMATHLNDNFGVRTPDGTISKYDDLHLLPFDGTVDWDHTARQLDACGYTGPLTFELSVKHEIYHSLPPAQFFALAYERACRVAAKRGNYGIFADQ